MYFLLIFQQLIAASTHIFAKSITATLHPVAVVFYRGMFSSMVFVTLLVLRRSLRSKLTPRDWWIMLLLGAVNMPLNQLLFIWGIKFTTAPNAALAYALSPAYVLIIERLMHGVPMTRYKTIGIAIAFAGTAVILFERGIETGTDFFLGNVMVLCAGLSWAFYTVMSREMSIRHGGVFTTAIAMLTGFMLFVPLYSLLPYHVQPTDIAGNEWFSLFYLGVVTSGLGFALWNFLLTKIEASKVSVFNNLQPVLTTILSIIIFSQQPSPLFIVGGVVALAGVIITQRG